MLSWRGGYWVCVCVCVRVSKSLAYAVWCCCTGTLQYFAVTIHNVLMPSASHQYACKLHLHRSWAAVCRAIRHACARKPRVDEPVLQALFCPPHSPIDWLFQHLVDVLCLRCIKLRVLPFRSLANLWWAATGDQLWPAALLEAVDGHRQCFRRRSLGANGRRFELGAELHLRRLVLLMGPAFPLRLKVYRFRSSIDAGK